MKITNISEKKLKTLEKLELPPNVLVTESEIYIYEQKEKWDKNKEVFKKLFITEGEIFSNKLYTVNELIEKQEQINIEELIYPKRLMAVKGKISGFTYPYIDNINLEEVLESKEFTFEQKINYLKEIGQILEKMKKEREYGSIKNFYLNDLHTSNFILNKQTGKINAVDLDSAKIANNLAQSSKYLTKNSTIINIPKYEKQPNNIGGVFKIDENTEIYCYIGVIFKFLFKTKLERISPAKFYMYLEKLSNLHIQKEILDNFSRIYLDKNNENPYELLEQLKPLEKHQEKLKKRI